MAKDSGAILFKLHDEDWFKDVGGLLELADTKTLNRIETAGIRKAGNVIKKEARKRLKQRLPAATKKNPKYNDTLIQGIVATSKVKNTYVEGKVHIMGNRKTGSGTYRLRFFELGTKRVRKDGSKYGIKKAKYEFFKAAATAVKSKAETEMDNEISRQIDKVFYGF